MRSRLPLILIALAMLMALVAAGCGSDESSAVEPVPSGNARSSGDHFTGSADADEPTVKKQEFHREFHKPSKDVSAKIDQAMRDARARCREAARTIPNAEAKSSALETCAKIK
jgi:hypothetical protein